METHFIQYGNTRINYELSYAERAKLAITVHADLRVAVEAPTDSPIELIEEKVRKRAGWILKQQRELARYSYEIPPHEYVSGESYRYLGRQYQLKVLSTEEKESVKLSRGRLLMETQQPGDIEHKAQLLEDWFREQAKRVFAERIGAWFPRFERYDIEYPELTVRKMKTHWGSCSATGRLTLNLKLIQFPKSLIDYIVVHELTHLVEHNHSGAFYQVLTRVMPDWEMRRDALTESDMF